jgi:predicted Rossmann fold flavoprotein
LAAEGWSTVAENARAIIQRRKVLGFGPRPEAPAFANGILRADQAPRPDDARVCAWPWAGFPTRADRYAGPGLRTRPTEIALSSNGRRAWDAVVIGAGAAGMMCAAVAGQRGARVLLIEHSATPGEKIRISGGGRCNFTNLNTRPENFLSAEPRFCRSALARYTPADFVALVQRYRIPFHEKHKGQLFCDGSAQQIIDMLRAECDAGNVAWRMPCKVERITRAGTSFLLSTDAGNIETRRVVIATGGLSIPKIGATDFGLRVAGEFGMKIVESRPALVPLTFAARDWEPFVEMAGISLEVRARCAEGVFDEDLLFTHRGLSGPAVLQISSYWTPGARITLDLAPAYPGETLAAALLEEKGRSRQQMDTVLSALLPKRLAKGWLDLQGLPTDRRVAEVADRALRELAGSLKNWSLVPDGSEGWRKAEVMRGGVSTQALSQATLECKETPGLHFIGEVVDVTGWLGGYNFQWAWASGVAAGRAIADHAEPGR